jgi:hypothetical protein
MMGFSHGDSILPAGRFWREFFGSPRREDGTLPQGRRSSPRPQQNGSDWIRFADVDHAEPISFKERVGADGFLLREGSKAHAPGQTTTHGLQMGSKSGGEKGSGDRARALAKK